MLKLMLDMGDCYLAIHLIALCCIKSHWISVCFTLLQKMHHTVLHSDAKNDCFGFHVWSRGYNSNFSRYGRIDFHILPSKISLGKPELDFSVGNPELAILRPTDWPSCICARFKVWFALWHSAIVFEL